MPVITCTACGSRLKAHDAMIGRIGKCPKCGMHIKLALDVPPAPTAHVPPSPAPNPSRPHEAATPQATSTSPPPSSASETPPPSTSAANAREAEFQTALAALYKSLGIRDARDYLAPLAAHFETARHTAAARRQTFNADLTNLYLSIAPPNLEKHLPALAQTLSAWRARAKARMAGYFAKLPADDPLRCPISLFGVMERGRLETAHTAVMAWLLDPRREHGFRAILLAELLARLSGPIDPESILVEKCEPEFAIADGRLDVLLQGTARRQDEDSSWSWLLMIEAKIDANESVGQLKRHEKWAPKNAQGFRSGCSDSESILSTEIQKRNCGRQRITDNVIANMISCWS